MELILGNLLIRPNIMGGAHRRTPRHGHNFGHGTFARVGWFLIRAEDEDGTERILQIASPEFAALRALLLKYEPHRVPRPVRFADTVDEDGRKAFDIRFIAQGEAVPAGGKEVVFSDNLRWFEEIRATSHHEIFCLSDAGIFDCTYSHRNPQGDVVLEYQNWRPSYE